MRPYARAVKTGKSDTKDQDSSSQNREAANSNVSIQVLSNKGRFENWVKHGRENFIRYNNALNFPVGLLYIIILLFLVFMLIMVPGCLLKIQFITSNTNNITIESTNFT